MKLKKVLLGFSLALSLLSSAHLQANTSVDGSSERKSQKNIVEILGAVGQFKTLAAALQATDLLATLEGEGPFTVLAPTDKAFAKLGQATIDSLLANPEQLKSILLYHVVSGQVGALQALKAGKAATINGAEISFEIRKEGFFVNDSRVLFPDITAANGVIHVIDTVLLPPAAN